MRSRTPRPWAAVALLLTGGLAACGGGQTETAEAADQAAAEATEAATAAEQPNATARFGVWQMESDDPPPAKNIMTYEPYGDGGMRITVASTNSEGEENVWGYVTLFDGEFRPVEGRESATTAVEVVDDRTTRILNARDGEVYQTIINALSEDGNTINNEYRRTNDEGEEVVSHAVYRRIN